MAAVASHLKDKRVLLIGVGLIGWNVLDLLLAAGYAVTVYVRRPEHAEEIKAVSGSLGSLAVELGHLDETQRITSLVAEHDIVIHCATADHKPSVDAVLQGIQGRAQQHKQTFYIHTSGTSVLTDPEKGERATQVIHYDTDRSAIDAVHSDAPHRPVDYAIVQAQASLGPEAAKIAIVLPPLIYGLNKRHKRLTIQIPTLTRFALKHGYAGYVGSGNGVKSQIHAEDLAQAYLVILAEMEKPSSNQFFFDNPYFFCENGQEVNWHDAATRIGRALNEHGKLDAGGAEPREIPQDLYGDLFGTHTRTSVSHSARSRAVRLRELGWKPVRKAIWESYLEDELPVILEQGVEGFGGYRGRVAQPK